MKRQNSHKFYINKKQRSLYNRKRRGNEDEDEDEDYDYDYDDDSLDCFYNRNKVKCVGNKIFFRSKVNDSSIDSLIQTINNKNNELLDIESELLVKSVKPNPLYLFITSEGGDLLAGFRAVDAISRSRIPIYTVVDGYAASAATLMSVVGKKRYITEHSYMLIHQLSGETYGKFWEIKDDFKNSKSFINHMYKIYQDHTNMEEEELKNIMSHDIWWDSTKCIDKGLVDLIYTDT